MKKDQWFLHLTIHRGTLLHEYYWAASEYIYF